MEWPLLGALSDDDRRNLLQQARRRRFPKGEVIFHEGDPGDTLHLVAKGHVAVRVTTPLGDTATLLVLQPGEFFGELAVVAPGPRNATIVALDEVETMGIHRQVLEDLRHAHPAVDRMLLDALITEVRRLSGLLVEALYLPVDKRTWRRLMDLARIYSTSDDSEVEVVVPLTQEDLAQVVGATRSTINKLLRSAEDEGVLRVSRGKLEILDQEALARRAR
jgi:CRP/FNR family cyclic AMP-dependent transcriptional regulator